MKRSLMGLCFVTLAASVCLGLMETALRPPFSEVRIMWAVMMAAASLSTILYLVLPEYRLLRILVSLGAVFMLSPAIRTIAATLRGEGYMLLIAAVLILQLALSILTLVFVPDGPDTRLHDSRLHL